MLLLACLQTVNALGLLCLCCTEMKIQSLCDHLSVFDYTRDSFLPLDVDYFAGTSSHLLKCWSVNLITGFDFNYCHTWI